MSGSCNKYPIAARFLISLENCRVVVIYGSVKVLANKFGNANKPTRKEPGGLQKGGFNLHVVQRELNDWVLWATIVVRRADEVRVIRFAFFMHFNSNVIP